MIRINLWSGPRNVSTAMMYSFAQRTDTTVVDEPLYAHYLVQTGLPHPGREEVLATQQHTAKEVIQDVLLGEYPTSVAFFKQMAHHLVAMNEDFMKGMKNVLLIRDPKYVIHSFAKVIPEPTLQDIGIARQWKLFQDLQAMGDTPGILDSMYFLQNPEKILTKLCEEYLDIPFDPAMLRWEAGARPEDGSWAEHWYHNVHQSTGFQPYIAKEVELADHLIPLWEESNPYYEKLMEYVIR